MNLHLPYSRFYIAMATKRYLSFGCCRGLFLPTSMAGRRFCGVFWGRRFARLYPLHFVTLLFVAGLQAYHLSVNGSHQLFGFNDTYHFILNLFMASPWGLEEGLSFNAPIWSVSVEVIVYFVFWLALPFLNKHKWLGPLVLLCGV